MTLFLSLIILTLLILLWKQRKSYNALYKLYYQAEKDYLILSLAFCKATENDEGAELVKQMLEKYN